MFRDKIKIRDYELKVNMKMNRKILNKAKRIRLVAMDIDGVLTTGKMIFIGSGKEIKIWDYKDRFAYAMLRRSKLDIKLAWITARQSEELEERSKDLKIEFTYFNCANKITAIENLVTKYGYKYNEILYMGDDWIDIPVLKKVGLAICPKDSVDVVKKYVDYVSKYNGGEGVFRESVELVLMAKNMYNSVFKEFIGEGAYKKKLAL